MVSCWPPKHMVAWVLPEALQLFTDIILGEKAAEIVFMVEEIWHGEVDGETVDKVIDHRKQFQGGP